MIQYTILAPLLSMLIAQGLKPFTHYVKTGKLDWSQLKSSGGLPSSHSAVASSLALTIGFTEGFDSSIFALAGVFSLIVAYDAMNVRYFAGENIRITRKLIDDLSSLVPLNFNDTAYQVKLKEVLGHTETEVLSGYALGLVIALILEIFF